MKIQRAMPVRIETERLFQLNAYWEALDFDLLLAPAGSVAGWQWWIDTSQKWRDDIVDADAGPTGARNAIPRGSSVDGGAVCTNRRRPRSDRRTDTQSA
jgi:hypothetical protein